MLNEVAHEFSGWPLQFFIAMSICIRGLQLYKRFSEVRIGGNDTWRHFLLEDVLTLTSPSGSRTLLWSDPRYKNA